MTRTEKGIYRYLEGEKSQIKLATIANLYAQGQQSSQRIYSKIDWERLRENIARVYGKRGLDHVRREAAKKQ